MDQPARMIKIALLGVLALPVLGLAAALLFPFRVSEPASIRSVTGEVELLQPGESPRLLDPAQDEKTVLNVGQSVRLAPGSSAIVDFELNQGRAVITGPALLTLADSYRRATGLGHISDRFERDYVLVLEQTRGAARYNFGGTIPAFDQVTITVRLPDWNFTPSGPCWYIEIATDGTSSAQPEECTP